MTTPSPSVSRLVWTPYEPEQINHKARLLVEANTRYDSNQTPIDTHWNIRHVRPKTSASNLLTVMFIITTIVGYVIYRIVGA